MFANNPGSWQKQRALGGKMRGIPGGRLRMVGMGGCPREVGSGGNEWSPKHAVSSLDCFHLHKPHFRSNELSGGLGGGAGIRFIPGCPKGATCGKETCQRGLVGAKLGLFSDLSRLGGDSAF